MQDERHCACDHDGYKLFFRRKLKDECSISAAHACKLLPHVPSIPTHVPVSAGAVAAISLGFRARVPLEHAASAAAAPQWILPRPTDIMSLRLDNTERQSVELADIALSSTRYMASWLRQRSWVLPENRWGEPVPQCSEELRERLAPDAVVDLNGHSLHRHCNLPVSFLAKF